MNLKVSRKLRKTVVIPCYREKDKINCFNVKAFSGKKKEILDMMKNFHYEGKPNEIFFLQHEGYKIVLIGIKKDYTLEELRLAYSKVYNFLKEKKEKMF